MTNPNLYSMTSSAIILAFGRTYGHSEGGEGGGGQLRLMIGGRERVIYYDVNTKYVPGSEQMGVGREGEPGRYIEFYGTTEPQR
jgi:hypothetical protein